MSNKKLEGLTLEELVQRKKVSKMLSYIVLGLILIYGAYMFIKMSQGTWESRNPIIVFPIFLAIVAFAISRGSKSIQHEIDKRLTK